MDRLRTADDVENGGAVGRVAWVAAAGEDGDFAVEPVAEDEVGFEGLEVGRGWVGGEKDFVGDGVGRGEGRRRPGRLRRRGFNHGGHGGHGEGRALEASR